MSAGVHSNLRALRTVPPGAGAALAAAAGAGWSAWAAHFGLRAAVARACGEDAGPLRLADSHPACHVAADVWLLAAQGPLPDAVASALFGSTASATGARVARDALDDLVLRLRASLALGAGEAGHLEVESVGSLGRAWSGAVQVRLRAEAAAPGEAAMPLELMLVVGPRAVAVVAPRSASREAPVPRPAAVPLWGAVAGEPVRLEIRLDPLELDLGALQSLRPGDVLPLSHALDGPLRAHLSPREATDATAPFLGGVHLGRRGERRAVAPATPFCLTPSKAPS